MFPSTIYRPHDPGTVCPACGKEIRPYELSCPDCHVTIFDVDAEGNFILLSPETLDKSKTYKVHGFDGKYPRSGVFAEFFPGDMVEILDEFPDLHMTDQSSDLYVDGGRFTRKFIMPKRDIYITRSTTGMAMNSTVYYGPYGERLKGPEYTEENILKEGEVYMPQQTPPMGMMGGPGMMGMMGGPGMMGTSDAPGMMAMMGMMSLAGGMANAQPEASSAQTVECPACHQMVREGKFCCECGAKLA